MVELIVRIPVTMSAVRANGSTASFDQNSRTGKGFEVTLTADTSATIRELEANSQGLSYDQMGVRVTAAIRDLIRSKGTRMNYNGEEEHYFEEQDDYDDPNDPGGGGSLSYGVPTNSIDNMTLSVDFMAVGPNAPAPVLDRLLQGAIRAPDSMYRKLNIFPEAWEEAAEGENCMVTQLFLAVTERVHTGSQKRGNNGAFVDANNNARVRTSKYTMEEWHTLTHDVELLMHQEKPVFKDGQVPSEAEIHELLRLRRMERQPELAAQLDEIANWLYDLLGKKGNKEVQGIVRAIHKRCNDWFKVLQRRWPQHKDRHGSVEALLRSRPLMFRFIIVRPANIPESIPREDMRLYEDKVEIAAQEDYRPIVLSDVVESWDRGAPFFNKTWKEVGVTTSMVYHIADEIGVGVMVMQDDILVGKHWPKNIERHLNNG